MSNEDEPKTATDGAAAARARRDSGPRRIGRDRYVLGEAIGRGGMGDVVAARDEQIGRTVAIKRILADAPNERHVERFLREARIQGRLEHPAIVPVHEVGRDDRGLPYFAMKKLAGTTLAEILAARVRDPKWNRQRLLRAFVDVCLAIEFAHVHGVLHRDIKPSNIMLGEFGEVYVLDWGVAKVVGEAEVTADISSDPDLTAAGAIVGTRAFMPPEQAGGDDVDERADVFSLGRVLAEILARDPVPELAAVVRQATEIERDERPASARALADTVQQFLDGDRDLALRRDLAREHLERAREALAAGRDSDDARRVAIEEGGRALALDPTLAPASALISSLLLAPPRTVPAEVERALADDGRRWSEHRARTGLRTHPAYLLGALSVVIAGHPAYLVPLVAATLVLTILDALIVRRVFDAPSWLFPLMLAPLLAVLAHLYSPAIVAPALAAIAGVNLALDPRLRRPRQIAWLAAVLAGSVLAPLAAERLGLVPTTMSSDGDALLLRAPGLLSGRAEDVLFVAFVFVIVGAAIAFGRSIANHELALRTRLHVISWHLGHLVAGRT